MLKQQKRLKNGIIENKGALKGNLLLSKKVIRFSCSKQGVKPGRELLWKNVGMDHKIETVVSSKNVRLLGRKALVIVQDIKPYLSPDVDEPILKKEKLNINHENVVQKVRIMMEI